VSGTEPHETCDQGGGVTGFFSRIFGSNTEKPLPPPDAAGNQAAAGGVQNEEETKKKKGFFGKIVDAFKGDDSHDKNKSQPSNESGKPPN
jgi:hypothetical protein